jgi:hypothetical protein
MYTTSALPPSTLSIILLSPLGQLEGDEDPAHALHVQRRFLKPS